MLRHLLVRLEDSPETEFAIDAALAFARGYGSTVTGLYVRHPAPVRLDPEAAGLSAAALATAGIPVARPGAADAVVTEGERQARALASFEEMAKKAGVPFRCDVRTGPSADEFAVRAGTADLVTMPRGESDVGRVGSDVEGLVRSVPHPFLIASEKIEKIERLAVAFDGSPGAVRALAAAADIAKSWKDETPEILLVEVLSPGQSSRAHLAEAEAYLDLYELPYRSITVHGVAAEVLPALAEREEVDILCMGAYGHWVLRDILLGSTTQAVIEQRRKPILLCH